MNKNLQLYKKYYTDKNSDNLELFMQLKDKFGINSAIYPGSFIHVTPSLVFPVTVFIDNDRRVKSFFNDPEVLDFIEKYKIYTQKPKIIAFQQNYSKKTPEELGQYDLLISQYAGFVSQECKQYLKSGGFLLVNNSHADAGLAFLDNDYEIFATLNHNNGKWSISRTQLSEYFIPKKGRHPSKADLIHTMRGVGYKKTATNYLFKKL